MARRFTADLSRFADLTKGKVERVMRQSMQDTITDMQTPISQGGNMPVDLSFLRNSLVSELDGALVAQGGDTFTLAIAQMKPGQVARFAYTADYAVPRHYAENVGQGGGLWRDKAAQKWQQTVETNARRVR